MLERILEVIEKNVAKLKKVGLIGLRVLGDEGVMNRN